eukprot:m.23273 g.23273  ORF g.23273 m.23273 type:complete len:405 (+) comp34873_c0_seq2:552-1766(+)
MTQGESRSCPRGKRRRGDRPWVSDIGLHVNVIKDVTELTNSSFRTLDQRFKNHCDGYLKNVEDELNTLLEYLSVEDACAASKFRMEILKLLGNEDHLDDALQNEFAKLDGNRSDTFMPSSLDFKLRAETFNCVRRINTLLLYRYSVSSEVPPAFTTRLSVAVRAVILKDRLIEERRVAPYDPERISELVIYWRWFRCCDWKALQYSDAEVWTELASIVDRFAGLATLEDDIELLHFWGTICALQKCLWTENPRWNEFEQKAKRGYNTRRPREIFLSRTPYLMTQDHVRAGQKAVSLAHFLNDEWKTLPFRFFKSWLVDTPDQKHFYVLLPFGSRTTKARISGSIGRFRVGEEVLFTTGKFVFCPCFLSASCRSSSFWWLRPTVLRLSSRGLSLFRKTGEPLAKL